MGTSSGSTGAATTSSSATGGELTGKVVKVDGKTIHVEHMGAIVPIKTDNNTKFTDGTLTRAKDLKEGQEIRASFKVKKTDNVAQSISLAPGGTGGSGAMSPDTSTTPPPPAPMPETSPDTGGSGSTLPDPSTPTPTPGSETGSPSGEGTGGSGTTEPQPSLPPESDTGGSGTEPESTDPGSQTSPEGDKSTTTPPKSDY